MTALIPTIVGLAASAAGTGLSISAANSAASNENQLVSDQIKTQEAASKKDQAVLGQSIEKNTPASAQQQIGQGAKLAQDLYNQTNTLPSTQTGSLIGAKNQESGNEQGGEYNKLVQVPAAQMQGLGQLGVNNQLSNQLTATQLGSTNFLSGVSSQAMPYLLNAAANQGSEGMAIGSLLNSMGGLASRAGAAYGSYATTPANNGFGQYGLMLDGTQGNSANYALGQIPG